MAGFKRGFPGRRRLCQNASLSLSRCHFANDRSGEKHAKLIGHTLIPVTMLLAMEVRTAVIRRLMRKRRYTVNAGACSLWGHGFVGRVIRASCSFVADSGCSHACEPLLVMLVHDWRYVTPAQALSKPPAVVRELSALRFRWPFYITHAILSTSRFASAERARTWLKRRWDLLNARFSSGRLPCRI